MARTKGSASKPKAAKKEKSTSAEPSPAPVKAAPKAKKAAAAKAKKASAPATKEFGYVSKAQAASAISELTKFIARSKEEAKANAEKSDLFADDDEGEESPKLELKFELKKFYTKKADIKPKLIVLPKPYRNNKTDFKTCLFLRDQFITSEAEVEKIEQANIPTLSKILTLTELKTVYKTFEKRRELLQEYDFFVVDDAILSSMPNTLGSTFYQNRQIPDKFPIHIRVASTKSPKQLSHQTLTNQIAKALSTTAFLPPAGTEISVTVGAIGPEFSEADLLANVESVLKEFSESSLITVGLQAAGSPVLPLYYADKIYEDSDVLENAEEGAEDAETEDVYTKALLELADETTVKQVLGKELKANKKKNGKGKTAKSEGKVVKP